MLTPAQRPRWSRWRSRMRPLHRRWPPPPPRRSRPRRPTRTRPAADPPGPPGGQPGADHALETAGSRLELPAQRVAGTRCRGLTQLAALGVHTTPRARSPDLCCTGENRSSRSGVPVFVGRRGRPGGGSVLLLRERPIERSPQGSLTAIEAAVIDALCYADAFDWPLTPAEVHRFASRRRRAWPTSGRSLGSRTGSGVIGPARRARPSGAARRISSIAAGRSRPRRAGSGPAHVAPPRRIGRLPFVRLVGVTGLPRRQRGRRRRRHRPVHRHRRRPALADARGRDRRRPRPAAARGRRGCARTTSSPSRRSSCPRPSATSSPRTSSRRWCRSRAPRPTRACSTRTRGTASSCRTIDPVTRRRPRPPRRQRARSSAPLRARPFDRLERWEMRRKIRAAVAPRATSTRLRLRPSRLQGPLRRPSARALAAYEDRLASAGRSDEAAA